MSDAVQESVPSAGRTTTGPEKLPAVEPSLGAMFYARVASEATGRDVANLPGAGAAGARENR